MAPSGSRRFGSRIVVGAVALLGVLAVVAAVVVWRSNDRTAGPANPGLTCATTIAARGRPLLAAPGVHRVLLIGDSIMDQASCSVAASLAGLGITTTRHAIPGTGLLTGPDWLVMIRPLLAQVRPDAVIAIFVGNYSAGGVRDAHGTPIQRDTPQFRAAWQARAAQLSKVVRGAGADMYWVSPPPFGWPPFQGAPALYAGYRSIAGDHFLDAGSSLAGGRGGELADTTTCGARRALRASDLSHLSPDGARIYGQTIARDFGRSIGLRTSPKPC
jgi:hypothetical protein